MFTRRYVSLTVGLLAVAAVGSTGLLTGCGGGSSNAVLQGGGATPTPAPSTSPTPTPTPSGSVSPSPTPTPSPSPSAGLGFAGLWSGNISISSGSTGLITGLMEITIDDNGEITGRTISTTPGEGNGDEGTVTGTITPTGLTSLNLTEGEATFEAVGTMALNASQNGLSGTLQVPEAVGLTVTVTLQRGGLPVE